MSSGIANVFNGFKEFVLRGNVIDLAVAVVLGAAFGAVIKAFTDFIIAPVLAVFGGADAAGFGFQITDNPNTFVDIGAVITAVIQFLITAAVIYFIFVLPMNKVRDMTKEPKEEAKPADVVLLEEIRDLLQRSAPRTSQRGPKPSAPPSVGAK